MKNTVGKKAKKQKFRKPRSEFIFCDNYTARKE